MLKKPLGSFVIKQVFEMGEVMEDKLRELDSNKDNDWSVLIDYNFQITESRKVRDLFIAYVAMNDKGLTFKFTSLESLFFDNICEAIYFTMQNPDDFDLYCTRSGANIELV